MDTTPSKAVEPGPQAQAGAQAQAAPQAPAGADGGPGIDGEAGLATAEYAIATIAAVGFAGLLIAVLKSDTVRGLLENIVTSALSV